MTKFGTYCNEKLGTKGYNGIKEIDTLINNEIWNELRYENIVEVKEIGEILDLYGYPQVADVFSPSFGLSADKIRGYLASDKKRTGDSVTLVVPTRIGECELREVPVKDLDSWLAV